MNINQETIEFLETMTEIAERLRIIAQPDSSARERYPSEVNTRPGPPSSPQNPGAKGRAKPRRFIHAAEDGSNTYALPTIEIPDEWRKPRFFIRVTSVTVPCEKVPYRCIHPYPIHTSEEGTSRDARKNALYFPVSQKELADGRKSFPICRQKVVQKELHTHFPLYIYNSNDKEVRHCGKKKQALINFYQLNNSQLVFSVGELSRDRKHFIIYEASSAYSVVMNPQAALALRRPVAEVQCTPSTGDWLGGDRVLMVIPRLDGRRSFEVHFEDQGMNAIIAVNSTRVAPKTLTFDTPPCPQDLIGNQTLSIPIVVTQNNTEVARVNFLYRSVGRCMRCDLLAGLPNTLRGGGDDEGDWPI